MAKRVFDVVFSLLAIIVLCWLFLLIILWVKLDSKGPALFKQRRVGKNKREFDILKFRSMYEGTPGNVPTHLLNNPGAFITRSGKILRKTSLDELPQLFNILTGDMSFVGPRPALYNQRDLISLREEYGINTLTPGLTGWAQVCGRDELPIPAKVALDYYYLKHKNFRLDIRILLLTVTRVIDADGIVEGSQKSNGNNNQNSNNTQ